MFIYFINFIIFVVLSFIFYKYFNLKIKYCILENENKNLKIYKKSPKIIAISYGNELYQKQLAWNKKSALEVGKVDEHYSFGPNDIDLQFKEKNKIILSQKRGNGYWLWKSYFLLKIFKEKLNDGDYIIPYLF